VSNNTRQYFPGVHPDPEFNLPTAALTHFPAYINHVQSLVHAGIGVGGEVVRNPSDAGVGIPQELDACRPIPIGSQVKTDEQFVQDGHQFGYFHCSGQERKVDHIRF